MNKKKMFYITLAMIMFLLLGSILINYILNPYGVFKKYKNYEISTPINERYLKTSYILDNPQKYDSFIFGSSRVGTLEGENLKEIGNFYNMTFSGAMPKEILEILELFIENKIEIKNIILGIDDFDFYTEPKTHGELLYKISYKKLKDNRYNFLKYYLLKNPFNKVNYTYLFKKEKGYNDILNTGKWKKEYADIQIENDIEAHKNKLSNIKVDKSYINRVDRTIEEINRIIKICEYNNINLTVIYLRLYKNTYVANKDLIDKSKKELQKITSYWDMVVIKGFTDNEYYWYEESHYRPILGRIILKRIFEDKFSKNINIPKNFGKYKNYDYNENSEN